MPETRVRRQFTSAPSRVQLFRQTRFMTLSLPSSCERAILEHFLKAEAMALWAVCSVPAQDIPPGVLQFLRRHEEEEAQYLKQFELLLGISSHSKTALPRMPNRALRRDRHGVICVDILMSDYMERTN